MTEEPLLDTSERQRPPWVLLLRLPDDTPPYMAFDGALEVADGHTAYKVPPGTHIRAYCSSLGEQVLKSGQTADLVDEERLGNQVPLDTLSRALDEVYALRGLLAAMAMERERDIQFKTFPKSRRPLTTESVETMRLAARGQWRRAVKRCPDSLRRASLRWAGADETLTRHSWEHERDASLEP